LVKALLDKLLARKKKTAVIVTSSIAGLNPMPGMCAYVSSKSFVTMMSITLSYECQDKLDVLSFNPGVVATPMTTNTAGEAGATSAEESVAACLRDLGHGDRMTLGMACHDNDLISITNTDPA
jgi:short-subunit dehydrogenase